MDRLKGLWASKKTAPRLARGPSCFRFYSPLLMFVVVLVPVDLARLAVLLAIDLGMLLRRQLAAVGLPVGPNLLVDARLVVLKVRGFTGRQLAALDALRDAVLLILLALADFALGIRILHGRVVLVPINLLRQLILLLVQRGLVGGRELAVVQFAHVALFLVQAGFLPLQIGSFTGGKLAALHAIGDAVLLILFAVLNRLARDRRRRRRRS